MDLGLRGKVVVITGAAGLKGSIGATILQQLAEEGAIPAVIDRNDRGFAYVEELQKKGIDALFCKTDVTKPEEVETAIAAIVKKYNKISAERMALPGGSSAV